MFLWMWHRVGSPDARGGKVGVLFYHLSGPGLLRIGLGVFFQSALNVVVCSCYFENVKYSCWIFRDHGLSALHPGSSGGVEEEGEGEQCLKIPVANFNCSWAALTLPFQENTVDSL